MFGEHLMGIQTLQGAHLANPRPRIAVLLVASPREGGQRLNLLSVAEASHTTEHHQEGSKRESGKMPSMISLSAQA